MSENPSLYHLGEELDRAIDRFLELGDDIVDTETGEVVDALAAEQTIADAAANFEAKLEACALKALNLEAQATVTKGEEQAFKKEYERLRDLRKLREARADRLKRYVAREMKRAETKKFEGERVELGVRETKAVDAPKEIPNLAKLARGPLVTKETVYKLNKDAVKGAWDERVEALAQLEILNGRVAQEERNLTPASGEAALRDYEALVLTRDALAEDLKLWPEGVSVVTNLNLQIR